MDARAMDNPDHAWDECGEQIADLFKADLHKRRSIADAWWCDLDEEEQVLVHEYVCEDKRHPDALEAAQRFEKYAAEREGRYREQAAKAAEKAAAAKADADAKDARKLTAAENVDATEEYQKFMALLKETQVGTARDTTKDVW